MPGMFLTSSVLCHTDALLPPVLCHAVALALWWLLLYLQHYSAAFLGMENTAYCSWITNPAHWGGGIELAILASHYRREIAAWNLATGACHVFGEDAGKSERWDGTSDRQAIPNSNQ
jgi:hypothetical protein